MREPMSPTPAEHTTAADDGLPADDGGLRSGTVVNLRDIGGHPTTDGRRVRTGVVYRSGQLAAADDPRITDLVDSGLRTVYDLRSASEREAVPDQVPDHVTPVWLDVLADSTESIAASFGELANDISALNRLLGSDQMREHYRATYRNLVSMASARDAYHKLFRDLAVGEGVALFHCTAGKDRTGWAGAVLLEILGVDEDVITEDYLASSKPVVEAFMPVIDSFAEIGGDPDLLVPAFEVFPEYLEAARSEISVVFGSFDAYLADGLGLSDDHLDALRDRLVT